MDVYNMKIVEKKIPDQKVAYVPHIDSFSKLPEFIEEVAQLIHDNGLEAVGFPYGSYDNDLEEHTEKDQIFEVGMPIKDFFADGKPAGRMGKLGLKELTAHTVLAARHVGSHKNFNESIRQMVDYALENQYDIVGPITEIYLPANENTPVEEVQTEIHLPVIYMGPKRD